MNSKHIAPGTTVLTRNWEGHVLRNPYQTGGEDEVWRTVQFNEVHYEPGSKALRKFTFTDGTTATALTTADWIVL